MISFTRDRIRLAVDVHNRSMAFNVHTGDTPTMWRGTDIAMEVAFFAGEELVDVSAFSSVTVEIRDQATRQSLMVAAQTLAGDQLSSSLTAADWESGIDEHAVFSWTAEDTAWELNGALQASYWVVISAITTDSPPRYVTLGATTLTVHEDGTGAPENSPTPGDPLYLTAEETQALLGQVVRPGNNPAGMTITLTSPSGNFSRIIGVADDGSAIDTIVSNS